MLCLNFDKTFAPVYVWNKVAFEFLHLTFQIKDEKSERKKYTN